MESRNRYVRRKQLEYESQRRAAEAEEWVQRRLGQLDNSRFAKVVGGNLAGLIGADVALARALPSDIKSVVDGAVFAHDLVNFGSPQHHAAVSATGAAINKGADYALSRAADPSLIGNDFRQLRSQLNRDLNPSATPVSPTFTGELVRRFEIGKNQGEAAWNVGTALLPIAGQAKGAVTFGRLVPKGPAKYIKMGATVGQAERFSLPYKGLNHHAYIPRDATWAKTPGVKGVAALLGIPDAVLNTKVPKWMVENPFNVVSSQGETGMFYKRHAGVDKDFNGGKVGRRYGGAIWNAEGLGWKKFGPLERAWHGMPDATKAVVVGVPTTLGILGGLKKDEKRRR